MTNIKLIDEINKKSFNAEMFGGFALDEFNFIKYFYFFENTINDVFKQINNFLVNNGYNPLDFEHNWGIDGITNELMSAYGNPYCNEQENANIILVIYRNIVKEQ